jgi:hypothetical protein
MYGGRIGLWWLGKKGGRSSGAFSPRISSLVRLLYLIELVRSCQPLYPILPSALGGPVFDPRILLASLSLSHPLWVENKKRERE